MKNILDQSQYVLQIVCFELKVIIVTNTYCPLENITMILRVITHHRIRFMARSEH